MQVYADVFQTITRDSSRAPVSAKKKHRLLVDDATFGLRDNDYTMGDMKVGGNAQAILRDRWLHHTSFLWDYQHARMALLQEPKRRPEYRGEREHTSFVSPLSAFGFDRQEFVETVEDAFVCRGFDLDLVGMCLCEHHHLHQL